MSVADDASRVGTASGGGDSLGMVSRVGGRRSGGRLSDRLRPHMAAGILGLIPVGLMLVWAVHNGGFDEDTWYWGALVMLGLTAALVVAGRGRLRAMSRARRVALVCFALYVAWSYASISWAQAPGVALTGSNRALLYLLIFTSVSLLPWTAEAALVALLTFALGVGVIALVLLTRMAAGSNVDPLFLAGRLAAPTGYINSTAALFTIAALTGVGLSARRELPAPVRGLLLALAAASLDMAVIVQSRGWLFTLPLVLIVAALVLRDRLRTCWLAAIPAVAVAIDARRLLKVYETRPTGTLWTVAVHAGRPALLLVAACFAAATIVCWIGQLRRSGGLSPTGRRLLGTATAVIAAGLACGVFLIVSHGDPLGLISRQWHGFSQEQSVDTSSHFTDVGSGRYDFWRVAADAFRAHPVGGLGQDNFADYYVPRRHTTEEPAWTHSLELRLLAHTGIVGFVLFAAFLVAAVAAALRGRRRAPPLAAAMAGVALLALIEWILYGSVDWFWEVPALSGPALGFLAIAGALSEPAAVPAPQAVPHAQSIPDPQSTSQGDSTPRRHSVPRRHWALSAVGAAAGVVTLLAAVAVLAFPYLSVREVSLASDASATDPARALADLSTAAKLNPLDSSPGRVAGAIALQTGQNAIALQRFRQSIRREPGGWFEWLGAGLAASALGDRRTAYLDFRTAYSINNRQVAVREALERVYTSHPLTSAQTFKILVILP